MLSVSKISNSNTFLRHIFFFSRPRPTVCLSCVFSFLGGGGIHFQSFLIWLWGIFFGLTMIFLALCMPVYIAQWFPFMQVFWGKGLFVILGGCLVGAPPPWYLQFITFVYCMVLGFGYIILHFTNCGCGPPQTLRRSGGSSMRTTTSRTTKRSGRTGGERLPPGWQSHIDPGSGQTYYVHSNGSTQWTRP